MVTYKDVEYVSAKSILRDRRDIFAKCDLDKLESFGFLLDVRFFGGKKYYRKSEVDEVSKDYNFLNEAYWSPKVIHVGDPHEGYDSVDDSLIALESAFEQARIDKDDRHCVSGGKDGVDEDALCEGDGDGFGEGGAPGWIELESEVYGTDDRFWGGGAIGIGGSGSGARKGDFYEGIVGSLSDSCAHKTVSGSCGYMYGDCVHRSMVGACMLEICQRGESVHGICSGREAGTVRTLIEALKLLVEKGYSHTPSGDDSLRMLADTINMLAKGMRG